MDRCLPIGYARGRWKRSRPHTDRFSQVQPYMRAEGKAQPHMGAEGRGTAFGTLVGQGTHRGHDTTHARRTNFLASYSGPVGFCLGAQLEANTNNQILAVRSSSVEFPKRVVERRQRACRSRRRRAHDGSRAFCSPRCCCRISTRVSAGELTGGASGDRLGPLPVEGTRSSAGIFDVSRIHIVLE
jgi:hypothetical protein